MDKCQFQEPNYQAEAERYETLFREAKEKNDYPCKELEELKKASDMKSAELEELKMALDKKSAELEEKQYEYKCKEIYDAGLQGQIEAYKFCIEHWRDR